MRVDYIRVPGNEWVASPDESFQSIDMLGPLMLLVFRLMEAVNADLPKGFALKEGELQAESKGLPPRVLREAIVNALMHRSYRVDRPTQIIRYDNRIEIINAGYSLKDEGMFNHPGSTLRNKIIAPVFHDTNLAEMKGSGIKCMRELMQEAQMVLPTMESNRADNSFTIRLLLHHLLDAADADGLLQCVAVLVAPGAEAAVVQKGEAFIVGRKRRVDLEIDGAVAGLELVASGDDAPGLAIEGCHVEAVGFWNWGGGCDGDDGCEFSHGFVPL